MASSVLYDLYGVPSSDEPTQRTTTPETAWRSHFFACAVASIRAGSIIPPDRASPKSRSVDEKTRRLVLVPARTPFPPGTTAGHGADPLTQAVRSIFFLTTTNRFRRDGRPQEARPPDTAAIFCVTPTTAWPLSGHAQPQSWRKHHVGNSPAIGRRHARRRTSTGHEMGHRPLGDPGIGGDRNRTTLHRGRS